MKDEFNFDSEYLLKPAVLPESQPTWNSQRLSAAIGQWNHGGAVLKRLNVSVWEDDECEYMKEHRDGTKNTLLCIEDICTDGNGICNICEVKFLIKNTFSKCFNLIFDSFFQGFSDVTLYQVIGDDRIEILGLPKWCKKERMFLNQATNRMEKKSAMVYTNIRYLLPWIKNILSDRCKSKPSSSVDCDELDCIEYSNYPDL